MSRFFEHVRRTLFLLFLCLNAGRRARRPSFGLVVLLTGLTLAACSPTFNWRTIENNDDGYTVDLPAKPSTDARPIEVAGQPMPMSMQTAEAGDAVFAVGTLTLPADDPGVQRAALDFLRKGLARNVGAEPAAQPVQVPLAVGGSVPGYEMRLSGAANGAHATSKDTRIIYARLVAKGRHVYQAAIIASRPVPDEQVEQFFSSFKLF